jgi:hypothetical protein
MEQPMTATKTCTRCKETKPVAEFYRRSRNSSAYRYCCKACDLAARRQGRSAKSQLIYEIVMHNHDPSFPLSPEAEAVVYTPTPVPEHLREACQKRLRLAEQGRLRRNRALRRLEQERGKRFGTLPPMELAA